MSAGPEHHALALRTGLERVIVVAFAATIALFTACALADLEPAWLVSTHRYWPFSRLGLCVVVYLGAATALAVSRAPRWLECVALPTILLALYLSTPGPRFGDHQYLASLARTDELWLSETLANLVWHVGAKLGVPFEFVPPAWGALTAAAFLWVTWEPGMNPRERVLRSWMWLATGAHLVFFRDYLENCSMGVFWIVLALGAAIRFFERGRTRDLCVASTLVAVAALFHGQAAALAPLVPVLCILRARSDGETSIARAVQQCAVSLVVFACVVLGVLGLLRLAGFELVTGNVGGGADGVPFVPFSRPADARWFRFRMFSSAHLDFVSDAVLIAAPLCAAGLLAVPRLWRGAWTSDREVAGTGAMCVASLGALAFLFVWNFDLGFPRDYDLIVSLGGAVLPWMALRSLLAWGAGRRPARCAASVVALFVATHFAWLTLSGYLR